MKSCPHILVKSQSPGMSLVLFRGAPFEILRSVVEAVRIFMVYFTQVSWVSDIRQSYKTMCKKFSGFAVFVEHDHFIPMTDEPGLQKAFMHCASIRSLLFVRPDSSIFSRGVQPFIARDVFHVDSLTGYT